ncbi:MAG: trehalose-6-phosphate synthase [Candidatus Aureabacteria bacterium]|nr:trehalose-6-phosphate synthase [Candidatus Auribacterota bacterium]
MALKLKVAQKSLSEQAALRVQQEELWTVDRLKDLIHAKLGENGFFVVSNREPYMHMAESVSGVVRCIRPASGVVTALDSIMSTCGGMWIAHGGGNADRKFVNSKNKLGVPPEDSRYILKRVWLNKAEEDGYYYGFSNEGLWPLCHNTHTRPVFRERDWQMYKKANQRFADAVLEEVPAKNPFIFIQDYHFTLLPQMIREKCPDAKIALFWHIPWPNSESFSICPFQKEILEGMLACDLIGFHVQYHCNNFFDTVNRFLECRIDMEKFSVVRSGYETFVKPFPISIDDKEVCFSDDDEKIRMIQEEREIKDMIIGVGVDRIDYTKGIVERLNAIDRFLEKYPSYRKKFVFIQIGAPSRVHIKSYHDLDAEIDEKVEKINWKYLDGNWKPILYLKKHFYVNEIRLYYKMADFCIVSSLHDGMNLVAKEYIMAKTDMNGVLLLSTFTGAWRELTEAIPINPYSIEEFADRIRLACEMPMDEKKKRMESLKKTIQEKNIYRWAGNIITEMTAIQKT